MVQSTTAADTTSSALEREANRVDEMMHRGHDNEGEKESKQAESGLNNPVQVEQDNRVAKAKADAKTAGGGPDHPEDGLNPDG